MTFAVYFLPEVTRVADTLVAWSMTWLLVSTRPLEEITMPVPSAVWSLYFSSEVMSTMPGSTFWASALALSEPVPVFAPPELLDPPLRPLPPPKDGSGLALPFPLPPKGLPCDPFPLKGETAEGLLLEWLSATAAPAPAAAASTATAT